MLFKMNAWTTLTKKRNGESLTCDEEDRRLTVVLKEPHKTTEEYARPHNTT